MQAANRYWISGASSNWNNTTNWSTTNGGAGGASVPLATDDIFFNNNGLGNCLIDIATTINSINITATYSGVIDINGNTFNIIGTINNEFAGGTINDTPGTSSLSINSTARTRFLGTTIGAIVNASSARLYLNGSIFYAACTFTKNGVGSDWNTGGNIFNSTVLFINSSPDYLLLGATNPDIFNDELTINNTGTSLIYMAHTSTGNQFNGNVILNSPSGNGIRFGNSTGTSTLAATRTITVGGSGFSSGTLRIRGFTQVGATTQAMTLTGTSTLYLEQNSTWNGNVNFAAPRVFIRQNTFNGTSSLTKTGASNDGSYGGNVFSSSSSIINSGTGRIYFAQTSADTFNGDVTLIVSNTGRLYMAHTAIGNVFNGNIFLNYITNTNIYIGNSSGTSALANTKTISVIGFGASGTGNLYLEEFTQLGATTQGIALNGTGILSLGPNSTFNADIFTSSPGLLIQQSTFNGIASFDKSGASGNTSYGGNTYNAVTTITNSGSNYLRLAGTSGNTYNSTITFSSSGSSLIEPSRVGNSTFNENIFFNSSSTSTGIRFGNGGGLSTLAATKTVNIGGSGFSTGQLIFRNFTQTGNTLQALTLTGTALLYSYDANWGGDVTFVAPRSITRGTLYNRTAYLEKTGATDDQSIGGNTFAMNVDFVNSGSGYLLLGNGTLDTYAANVTLTNTGSRHMYFAYNGIGHSVSGDLTATNSGTGNSGMYIGSGSTSTLAVNGNISLTQNGTGNALYTYLGDQGDITANGTVTMINSGTGTTSDMRIANNTNSTVSIAGATSITNNNTATTTNRIYVGEQGDIIFNGTLDLINNAGAANSQIYCNRNVNSNNIYNQNITVQTTNATSDGIRFGGANGAGTLAATKTITIGAGGFIAGELRFRNFTQTGNTAHALTLTGTGLLYNYNANWGGDVTFVAPRNITRGTLYNRTAYLEKNGAINDQSIGGNTFAMNVDFVNSGSGYLLLGNGTLDTYAANVTLTNTGSRHMYFAYNGIGHSVSGDLTATNSGTGNSGMYIGSGSTSTLAVNGNISLTQNGTGNALYTYLGDQGDITANGTVTMINSGTGTTSDMRIANNTNSTVSIAGATSITNNNTATTTNRIYVGEQGDIIFNGTLDLINNAGAANSQIYCNRNVNSNNIYNQNITVQTTNATSDGIRFGGANGAGTLAATKTITIGAGGFIAGELRFRNFTQTGNTAHALTLTGTGLLYNYNANWGGDVTFVAPRNITRGTLYNQTAYLEKTGTNNDASTGGNIFNGATTLLNSGTGYFMPANGTGNDFNSDVTYTKANTGLVYPSYNSSSTYAGNLTINSVSTIRFGAATNGHVIFDGNIAQSINTIGATPTPEFRGFQTANPNNEITLNTPVIVLLELDLDQGNIITSPTNIVYMNDNSVVSSVSNNAFIDGPIEKRGNDIFTFPVGNNSFYRPISMTAPSNTAHAFRAQYFENNPHPTYDITLKDPSIDHVSGCEYWILDRTNGASNVTVTPSWDVNSCGVTNLSELTVARWDGTMWKDHGNGATTGNLTTGTVSTSGSVTSFSPFTLASSTASNPLPVEIIAFNAKLSDNKVNLNWITASEINNDYFTIEKSKDALYWEYVNEQNGAGNSNTILKYNDVDEAPYQGISYYRLKQVDFNGDFDYSNIISVSYSKNRIDVYPNPVKNVLNFTNLNATDIVKIYSVNGQLVYQGNTNKVNTSTWDSGIYEVFIISSSGDNKSKHRIVK